MGEIFLPQDWGLRVSGGDRINLRCFGGDVRFFSFQTEREVPLCFCWILALLVLKFKEIPLRWKYRMTNNRWSIFDGQTRVGLEAYVSVL
jgi:hypothetical protein